MFLSNKQKQNPKKTIESETNKPMQTPSFEIPLQTEEYKWLVGSTNLELYKSIFDSTEAMTYFSFSTRGCRTDPETMKKNI